VNKNKAAKRVVLAHSALVRRAVPVLHGVAVVRPTEHTYPAPPRGPACHRAELLLLTAARLHPTTPVTLSTRGGGAPHHLSPTHGAQGIRPHKSSTSAPLVSTAAAAISGPFSSPKGQASRLPSRPPFRPPAFALPSPCPPSNHSIRSASPRLARPHDWIRPSR